MVVENTIRFLVPEERREDFDLNFLVNTILVGKCKVQRNDIFCIQDFQKKGLFDITFYTDKYCLSFYEKLIEIMKDPVMLGISMEPLFLSDEKTVTVHVYNPFTDWKLIAAFLCERSFYVKPQRVLFNEFGIFCGKVTYDVKLLADRNGYGGVKHLPSSFNVAGYRGFLSYPGQPKYCKKCCQFGHIQKDCQAERLCRHCGNVGHAANVCPHPKCCDICGKDHFAKQCPVYQVVVKKDIGWFQSFFPGKDLSGNIKPREPERENSGMEKAGGKQSGKDFEEKGEADKAAPDKKECAKEKVVLEKEEEVKMDFQASKVEEKEALGGKVKKQRRKIRIIKERFFYDKLSLAEIRAKGFETYKGTDYLVVPEDFVPPKEWVEFDKYCTMADIT